MKFFLVFFFLISCAQLSLNREEGGTLSSIVGTHIFSFEDYTGTYRLTREVKLQGGKLISRNRIFSSSGSELETTVAVSLVGTKENKSGRKVISILPEASQFSVWFDKKKYFSQSQLIRDEKKIEFKYQGGDSSNINKDKYNLNSGTFFCYFSQIPDCLKLQNLLVLSAKKTIQIYVIWDNFPYNKDQYQGINAEPVTLASLSLDKYNNNEFKYILDLGNQVIFYTFDKKLEFTKMFWVSQGISMIKQGRE